MKEAVIVSGARTAVGRAPRGTLREMHPVDLAAAPIRAAVDRAEGLDPQEIEDVIYGCAMPEGTQGYNIARLAAMRAGLPESVPAQTVNRFCSSGLQTIAIAAERIMVGHATTIVAGGVEHMSSTLEMPNFAPNPALVETNPAVYMGMGLTAEQVAREFGVSREDQDEFALRSHTLAAKAVDSGLFDEEIVPLEVSFSWVDDDGEVRHHKTTFRRDEGPRRDTSAEALAKLKPVFQQGGTVTAGNSSQRSDGAAAVVVMEREEAERRGLEPLARFLGFAVGGVRPEVMGIGPTVAIPKVLKQVGLSLDQIDLIEFNEAFAAQALAVIREVGLDLEKTNVNGGAIALGHPMGATGTKLTIQLIHEMKRRGSRYGMVTMCIGGGMGAAGVFENLQ
ncbi:MAG: acetyl-CoA C-acyltransferase [Rubrobacteraceae bacterium]|uniref:acetyl-CoA C-acyltransferase n=1 Tax=Rubrobacter naiadicus TaxID=1392641 RepID=UPI00235FFF10|nr:acetyl-CoA C-acyltransferase [Rubrobacter naiadicus]MBX6762536.1 acetyl-CoA C-acyltransferase [Rubrobacteraceae bacterium]